MRMPAPCSAFCALSGPRIAPRNAAHERTSPIEVTVCERSGSYRPRIEACVKMSVPPSERGVQVVAFDFRGTAEMALDQDRTRVSAERDRRGVVHGAAGDDIFRLADVGDDGLERQADAAGHAGQARDAPMTLRNPRRETESTHSEAPFGNSRCSASWKSSLPASSSRLRQYSGPVFSAASWAVAASILSRTAFRSNAPFLPGQTSSWCRRLICCRSSFR